VEIICDLGDPMSLRHPVALATLNAHRPQSFLAVNLQNLYTPFCLVCAMKSELTHFRFVPRISEPGLILRQSKGLYLNVQKYITLYLKIPKYRMLYLNMQKYIGCYI